MEWNFVKRCIFDARNEVYASPMVQLVGHDCMKIKRCSVKWHAQQSLPYIHILHVWYRGRVCGLQVCLIIETSLHKQIHRIAVPHKATNDMVEFTT